MKIYADNAATTKLSAAALSAMLPYYETVYANPSSLHSFGQEASAALTRARMEISELLDCAPSEIYFTASGSEADNQAIISAAIAGEKNNKRHIISTAFEHHAVLNTLKRLEKQGFEITLLDVHESGLITADEVRAAFRPDTCLVTVMYANNEIGTVQPIAEIGAACKKAGIPFHTDMVQAAGHLSISLSSLNADLASLSAHKFHGPKGVGVLYAKRGTKLFPLIEGGSQERGMRAGTENIPGIVGTAAALKEALDNLDKKNEYLSSLRDRLISGILKIPHSALNGDPVSRLPGNASFCFEGIEGESLLLLLDDKGICASSGSACTSGSLDPSHVLLSIGRPHEVAHGSLRLTISEKNTAEEIDYMIKSVSDTVSYLRGISPVWRDLCNGKRNFILK